MTQTPKKSKECNFYKALEATLIGKNISRLAWPDKKEKCFIATDGILKIKRPDGKIYNWTISEGDISATDWIIS